MKPTRTGWAGALALTCLIGSCVARLPIDGTECPCPVGYCCVASVCRAGAACVDSGTDGAAVNDGPSEAAADAAETGGQGLVSTRVPSGDEVAAGISATGRWLFTYGTPRGSTYGVGKVLIHDLEGIFLAQDLSTRAENIWLSPTIDSAIIDTELDGGAIWLAPDSVAWLSGPVLGVSPDDRFAAVDMSASQDKGMHVGIRPAFPRAAFQEFDSEYKVERPVFSDDSAFAFFFAYAPPTSNVDSRLVRVATEPLGRVTTFANAAFPKSVRAVDFAPPGASFTMVVGDHGTAGFFAEGGLWVWYESSLFPVLLVPATSGALLGASHNTAYATLQLDPVSDTQMSRISLLTGQSEPLGPASAFHISSLSIAPDGAHAIARLSGEDRALYDLKTMTELHRFKSCGERCLSPLGQLAFTPSSRWLYGSWPRFDKNGATLWLSNLVAIDTGSSVENTSYAGTVAGIPQLADADRIVFVAVKDAAVRDVLERDAPRELTAVGDLVAVSLETGAETLLAHDVDVPFTVRGRKVAFSRHGRGADDGLFIVELSP